MKVSVLISCHNYAHLVSDAIDSVLAQDYAGEVEIIVVDDGSTDGSPGVLARYGDQILALCQANAGMCAALNSGYRRATGDVISFLDADDVWLPGKLSAVVRELERRPAVGMVFHHVRTVDKDGAPVRAPWDRGLVANGDVADSMWLECLPWRFRHTSSVSLRRKIASLVFPLATRLRGNADDLITGVAALLAPVSFLPEVLSLYRVHGDNIFAARFLEEYNNARGGQPAAASPAKKAAAPSRGMEDVDAHDRRTRQIRLSEEQARFANEVLSRAGIRGTLSPWSSPLYRAFRLSTVGRDRLAFLLPVLLAYGAMRPVPLTKRVWYGAKALSEVVRGAG